MACAELFLCSTLDDDHFEECEGILTDIFICIAKKSSGLRHEIVWGFLPVCLKPWGNSIPVESACLTVGVLWALFQLPSPGHFFQQLLCTDPQALWIVNHKRRQAALCKLQLQDASTGGGPSSCPTLITRSTRALGQAVSWEVVKNGKCQHKDPRA